MTEDETPVGYCAIVAIVITAAVFAASPPLYDHTVTYSVSTDTQAQSSVPANATVYGQPNMTASEYELFMDSFFGETISSRYGTDIESKPRDERVQDIVTNEVSQDTRKVLLQKTMQADYVQADGQYYPVKSTFTVTDGKFLKGTLFTVPVTALFISVFVGAGLEWAVGTVRDWL